MTMPSEKARIVAGDQEAIRRLFKVRRVSTGNVPTLPAIFPDGIAPVRRTNDDERELLKNALADAGASVWQRCDHQHS